MWELSVWDPSGSSGWREGDKGGGDRKKLAEPRLQRNHQVPHLHRRPEKAPDWVPRSHPARVNTFGQGGGGQPVVLICLMNGN